MKDTSYLSDSTGREQFRLLDRSAVGRWLVVGGTADAVEVKYRPYFAKASRHAEKMNRTTTFKGVDVSAGRFANPTSFISSAVTFEPPPLFFGNPAHGFTPSQKDY